MIAFQSMPHYQRKPAHCKADPVFFGAAERAHPVSRIHYNPAMRTLSNRLAEARKAKGWSQIELAKRVGCSQSLIGNLEAERQKESAKIPRIAEVLGVNALWLADGKGPREPAATTQPHKIEKIVVSPDLLCRVVQAINDHLAADGSEMREEAKIRLAALVYSGFHDKPDTTADEITDWLDQWWVVIKASKQG